MLDHLRSPQIHRRRRPGDEVRLLADQGAYKVTKQITIAAGGAAGAPVTIRGATSDGTAMAATIVGTRATGGNRASRKASSCSAWWTARTI